LLHPALGCFDTVLAQTEADAARLRASGAREVRVAGNLKFEITLRPELLERGRGWKARLGRPVVLAAVTREGEEAPLLAAWQAAARGAALLVIVPRHPQRFDDVAALVAGTGLRVARRSGFAADGPSAADRAAEVWLGDSLGEMPAWYALADVALLGGSFAPLGGQNLIEAAACGCPLLMGPHTFNFALAADLAIAAGAARREATVQAAVAEALRLLADGAAREAMATAGRAFTAAHRGAAARMADAVLALPPR
jgi:3-deoxy-D-manno-octulosonic-acid transferase